jgi:ribosomal protein L37AE/L43A
MEGIIWLFLAQVVALAVLAVVLAALRRRPSGVDPKPRHCSNCQTPMSLRRVSIFESLMLRGIWMCPHCGTIMSKKGSSARTPI